MAGIRDRAEADLVQECGVRYLGFALRLPVNREDLTEPEAEAIIRSLRPPARGVLITYLDEAEAIAGFCRTLGATMVQLHGDILAAELPDYQADGIHMNSVDTGWVTDEDAAEIAARRVAEHRFHPPLDIVDGAARIVDPIIAGINTGEHVGPWRRIAERWRSTRPMSRCYSFGR